MNTPVLFLIFNRPALTEQAFAQIKKAQPKQLFVSADGPRDNKPGEKDLCEAARNIVMQNIDWPCEVKTLYREKNAGCNVATVEALTWFFNNVEEGLMVEDDCLFTQSYFKLCDELLARYKNDDKIIAITGVNYLEHEISSSYFFSMYGGSWGLATWRRAWQKFDYNITTWKKKDVKKKVRTFMNDDNLFNYYSKIFDWHLKDTKNGVWDYRWLFYRLSTQGLSIVPAFNQITNTGFGPDASHTLDLENKMANLKKTELVFPLKINNNVVADSSYDGRIYKEVLAPNMHSKITLKQKFLRKLKKLF